MTKKNEYVLAGLFINWQKGDTMDFKNTSLQFSFILSSIPTH